MPMRILAIVAEPATARSCLDGALALAADDPTAEIEAYHVKVDPDHMMASPEEISMQLVRERTEGTADARATEVRTIFEAWRQHFPAEVLARVSWREDVGAEWDRVIRKTKGADFLVVGRPRNLDGSDALLAAVFKSHRPLLVAPERMPNIEGFARHMMIAWTSSPQAYRAVTGAGPWLRRAERVSLVMLAKDLASGGWPEAERLSRTLGFTAEPQLIAPRHGKAGDQLIEAATRLGADAMVLGAFQHNSMIEWALPSTTRHMIQHAGVPLFLAH